MRNFPKQLRMSVSVQNSASELDGGYASLSLACCGHIIPRVSTSSHESGNAMDAPQRDEPGAQRSTLATAIGVKADAWGHGKLGGLLSGKLGDNRYLVRVTPAIRRRATALCTECMP